MHLLPRRPQHGHWTQLLYLPSFSVLLSASPSPSPPSPCLYQQQRRRRSGLRLCDRHSRSSSAYLISPSPSISICFSLPALACIVQTAGGCVGPDEPPGPHQACGTHCTGRCRIGGDPSMRTRVRYKRIDLCAMDVHMHRKRHALDSTCMGLLMNTCQRTGVRM